MCNWYPSTWWWSKKRGLMFSWCIPVEVFNSWKKYFCFFKRTPRPKIWNFGGSLNWRLSTPATLNPSVPPLLWSQPRVFSIVLDPVQSQHGFSPVIPELSLFGGTLQKQYLTVQFYCPKTVGVLFENDLKPCASVKASETEWNLAQTINKE